MIGLKQFGDPRGGKIHDMVHFSHKGVRGEWPGNEHIEEGMTRRGIRPD